MEPLFALLLYASGHTYVVDFNLSFDDCITELFGARIEILR